VDDINLHIADIDTFAVAHNGCVARKGVLPVLAAFA
jgi:hypothetical protein